MTFEIEGENTGGPIDEHSAAWLYMRLVPGHKDLHEMAVGETSRFEIREATDDGYVVRRLS